MSKITSIDTPEGLLEAFDRLLDSQGETEPYVHVTLLPGGGGELSLKILNQKFQFSIQPNLYPSRKLADQGPPNQEQPVILVCPHIPDELANDYRKQGINHADLNNRLFLKSFNYIIDRQPKGQTYRNPVSEPDMFSLKSSRIIRAFLSNRQRAWTQEDIEAHTHVSRGLVSRILTTLKTHGYVDVVKGSSGSAKSKSSYRLQNFERLLDGWKAADSWLKRVKIVQYSVLTNDLGELATNIRDTLGADQVLFTQWFAAHLRHPYTTPPLVSAYLKTRQAPNLPLARKVQTGGSLWLILPADEGVFFDVQVVRGFNLVSDVQIYLDLLQVGQRGPDQADALRLWEGFAR